MYHQQQNKWYPQRCLFAHFEATANIECSFEMSKKSFGSTIYFAADGTSETYKSLNFSNYAISQNEKS